MFPQCLMPLPHSNKNAEVLCYSCILCKYIPLGLSRTKPCLGNAGTTLQLELESGADPKHSLSETLLSRRGLWLSGVPHYPTTSLLYLKKKTQLVCEPEGDEETQAPSLATSTPQVSLRDRRGSASWNFGSAALVPPEGCWQVCRGSGRGGSMQSAKEQGGERTQRGQPTGHSANLFPRAWLRCQQPASQKRKRAMEMVVSFRSPKKPYYEDFAKIEHPRTLTLSWEQQGWGNGQILIGNPPLHPGSEYKPQ